MDFRILVPVFEKPLMTSLLLGIGAALAWGIADFIARFTSLKVGPSRSLLGAMVAGIVALTLLLPFSQELLLPSPRAALLCVIGGLLNMGGLLILYAALARGPVTVVAPVIAGHPALAVGFLVFLGVVPGPQQWVGMMVTMAGLILLTRAVGAEGSFPDLDRHYIRNTIRLSAVACLLFGVQIVVMQEARLEYGVLSTTWLTRAVTVSALLLWMAIRREAMIFPLKELPRIGLQGLLDALGVYLFLFGSSGTDRAVVVVLASCFSAVTVLLARFVLKEAMSRKQWAAIAVVLAGVAALAAAP